VTYGTEFVTFQDEVRRWFSEIVARKTGGFAILEYAARFFDIT